MADVADKRASVTCAICSGEGFQRLEGAFPYSFKRCVPCNGAGRVYPNAPEEKETTKKAKPFGVKP